MRNQSKKKNRRFFHHSAFSCDVLTICGKSMTTGSPLSRLIRMLNSLKSPCMRPACANRTIRSIKSEYSLPGDGTSDICRLRVCERTTKTILSQWNESLQRISILEFHQDAMPRLIDRTR